MPRRTDRVASPPTATVNMVGNLNRASARLPPAAGAGVAARAGFPIGRLFCQHRNRPANAALSAPGGCVAWFGAGAPAAAGHDWPHKGTAAADACSGGRWGGRAWVIDAGSGAGRMRVLPERRHCFRSGGSPGRGAARRGAGIELDGKETGGFFAGPVGAFAAGGTTFMAREGDIGMSVARLSLQTDSRPFADKHQHRQDIHPAALWKTESAMPDACVAEMPAAGNYAIKLRCPVAGWCRTVVRWRILSRAVVQRAGYHMKMRLFRGVCFF